VLAYVLDNRCEIGGRPRATSESSFGAKDTLHLAANFLVRNGLALIQGGKSFFHLLPEPFVVIEVVGHQLLDDLARSFSRFRLRSYRGAAPAE